MLVVNKQSDNLRHNTAHANLALGLIGTIAFLQMYAVQAILPDLMQKFSASVNSVGALIGITVLAVAITSPFAGMLSDRVGRKNLIVISTFLLASATIMLGFSHSITAMKFWRFMQGICIPAITVSAMAYAAEELPKSAMSYYVAGTVLGGFLGRFLLGHLSHIFNITIGFWALGLLSMMGAIWIYFFVQKERHFVRAKFDFSNLYIHAKNPAIQLTLLLGASVLFSLVAVFTYVNLHLANTPYLLKSDSLANLFSLYLIGMAITPLSGRLYTRFGAKNTLTSASLLGVFGTLLCAFTPLWIIIAGLVVISTGVFIAQATIIAHLATLVNQGRSAANGLYYLGYYLGGGMGAWLGAWAWAHFGFVGVLGCVAWAQISTLILVRKGL